MYGKYAVEKELRATFQYGFFENDENQALLTD